MAGIAIYGCMSANQGNAVLMFVDVMDRDLPPAFTMAQVTLRSVFPPVNIGVAVLTLLPDVSEGQIDVAILAGNLGMQPTQGKTGLAMIKFWQAPDGLPSGCGVTVLARDFQLPMRTTRCGFHIRFLPVATC